MAMVSSSGSASASVEAEQAARDARARFNLRWLIKLRWAAVLGQLVTVFSVNYLLDVDLPKWPLTAIIGLTAITNLVLEFNQRRASRRDRAPGWLATGETLLGLIMVGDVLILTALLFFTGGSANPFSIFYLINVVLGAIVLRPTWAWALGIESTLCFALLSTEHLDLAALGAAGRVEGLAQWGMVVAFSAVALAIAWFVVRITEELAVREADLLAARQSRARHERIEALITLAAGAAHELSTPLATIAISAGELQHELEIRREKDPDLEHAVADLDLIKSQLKRCRSILEQMSADSGAMSGEILDSIELGQLMSGVLEALPHQDRIRYEAAEGVAERSMVLPRRALTRALRGLVKNALDASEEDQDVSVQLGADAEGFDLEVVDQGEGMSEEVLARVFDPFYTTKETGAGMGLGLYLTRSVIERLGGTITMESEFGRGTRVHVRIPFSGPEHDAAMRAYADAKLLTNPVEARSR